MNKFTTPEKKLASLLNFFNNDSPALALDFDGVISELKENPRTASIDEYCLQLIIKLNNILPNISIISGRNARDLESKIGLGNLTYIGNHGAEYIKDGKLIQQSPEGTSLIVKSALDYIKSQTLGMSGIFHENKTISASIHYRGSKDHKNTKMILTKALKDIPNIEKLDIFWGKQILEIRPHSKFNKGYAIKQLIETKLITNIIFLGDDTTDLDAMIQIKKLRDSGIVSGFSIYVTQDNESNSKLIKNSDYSINGIKGVRETLDQIYHHFKSSYGK